METQVPGREYGACSLLADIVLDLPEWVTQEFEDQDGAADKRLRYLILKFSLTCRLDDFKEAMNVQLVASTPTEAEPDSHRLIDEEKLNECISAFYEALPKSQNSPVLLNGLATSLFLRSYNDPSHGISNLDESISLFRQAAQLVPDSPSRCHPLYGLSAALFLRFIRLRDQSDIEEVHCLLQVLLVVSRDFSDLLKRAAHALSNLEEDDQLNLAISLYREALHLMPIRCAERPLLLTTLGQALSLHDKQASAQVYRERLRLFSSAHPSLTTISRNLGNVLRSLYDDTHLPEHLSAAVDAYRTAVLCELGIPMSRFNCARDWAQTAHTHKHNSALEAYRHAMYLFPRIALLGMGLQRRRGLMSSGSAENLPCSAASCAIGKGRLEEAVEYLELRSWFWTMKQQLRTPLDNLMTKSPDLGNRLRYLSAEMGQQDSKKRAWKSSREEKAYYQALHKDYYQTLENIRALDGFHDFLSPISFLKLKASAANGPVVFLNTAAEGGCDALVVTSSGVHHIPLTGITHAKLFSLRSLLRDEIFLGKRSPWGPKEFSDVHTRLDIEAEETEEEESLPERRLGIVLSSLWEHVAQPVIRALGYKESEQPPHLWWCPTSLFSSLPIHAAGIYSGSIALDCVANYAISSYTPSLAALLNPPPSLSNFKMLVVIQPEIQGLPHLNLPKTRVELQKIQVSASKRGIGSALVCLGDTADAPSRKDIVLQHLSDSSFVHFACHGRQYPEEPLKSALRLSDGDLQLSEIMTHPMPNALLAFLSACEMARGDQAMPDEMVHVATAMLFVGFRGIVATLWSIEDEDAPKVAETFYDHIFRDCHGGGEGSTNPDARKAAEALHVAIKKLRSEGCTLCQWVPFVHYGI